MSRHDVLIISADALAGALIGAAVELAGHHPRFPEPNETARDALRRTRPRVVVVDADDESACSDAFLGPALMTGARLLVFASHRHGDRGLDVASRLALDVVHLPDDYDRLLRELRDLAP